MERKNRVIEDRKIERQYEDSPIEILNFQILQDEETDRRFLCCKMKNIEDKVIKGCILAFVFCDETGREMEGTEKFEYKNIFIESGEEFGENIFIPFFHVGLDRFHFYIEHVFFTDKTVWNSKRILTLEHPQQLICDSELEIPMRIACRNAHISRQAKYIPDIVDRFWRCTCGEMNLSNENTCKSCGVDRTLLHEVFDVKYLEQIQSGRREEKKQVKKNSQRRRREEIRQKLEDNTTILRQWMGKVVPVLGVIVLIVGFLVVGTQVLLPRYYYAKGTKQLEAKRYVLAQKEFEKADDYKNAQSYVAYTAAMAHLSQVGDETNIGQIYNEIYALGSFQQANRLLEKNSYLKQIGQIQGKWDLYENSKKKTYTIEQGNMMIQGENVYQIVAYGDGIGLQSGSRGEISEVLSVTKNQMIAKSESQTKVFYKNSDKKDSIYFAEQDYQTMITSMAEKQNTVLENMKKDEGVFLCRKLIEYLYGKAYVDFAQLDKAYVKKLEEPGQLALSDGTVASTYMEVYVDILVEKNQEEDIATEEEIKHYMGYFDETGTILLGYNELTQEIPNRKNQEELVEAYQSYEVPNLTIPICQKVIETELEKDVNLRNTYFTVSLVDIELSTEDKMLVHIWGKTSSGEYRKIDGVVGSDYIIESTSSVQEQADINQYSGTPVFDYGEEFASYF